MGDKMKAAREALILAANGTDPSAHDALGARSQFWTRTTTKSARTAIRLRMKLTNATPSRRNVQASCGSAPDDGAKLLAGDLPQCCSAVDRCRCADALGDRAKYPPRIRLAIANARTAGGAGSSLRYRRSEDRRAEHGSQFGARGLMGTAEIKPAAPAKNAGGNWDVGSWDDGEAWSSARKSYADRKAEHAAALHSLTATRDKAVAAARLEIQRAQAAHATASAELEASHAAANRRELERTRITALESLTSVIAPWRKQPTRAGTEEILKAWADADADTRHATGAALHHEVLAYAFAADMIAEDPDAVRAFAEHNALTAPSFTTQPLAHQAYTRVGS